jgi:excisionase family DNA binding protein
MGTRPETPYTAGPKVRFTRRGEEISTPWMTVAMAAAYARVGSKLLRREIAAGRLRAARIGGRRDIRILSEWIDQWLVQSSTPVEIRPLREARRG